MPPTTAELALDSLAIGHAAGIRDTGRVDSPTYARMRECAKDDATELLTAASGDDSDPATLDARKKLVLHLTENGLAQAINYHAMIHAGLVIDAETDRPYTRCEVCHADLFEPRPETPEEVRCRAKVSPNCYHGRKAAGIYPDGADEDGTYREEDGTVVCDPCYIALGQPQRGRIEAAIAAAKGA